MGRDVLNITLFLDLMLDPLNFLLYLYYNDADGIRNVMELPGSGQKMMRF